MYSIPFGLTGSRIFLLNLLVFPHKNYFTAIVTLLTDNFNITTPYTQTKT